MPPARHRADESHVRNFETGRSRSEKSCPDLWSIGAILFAAVGLLLSSYAPSSAQNIPQSPFAVPTTLPLPSAPPLPFATAGPSGRTERVVGVSTHVQDLEALLWFEDLREVHLVLHSYAGVLAGPLAERVGDRLSSVVYLGAFATAPGESLLDVEPADVADRYRRQVADEGEGWYLPATDAFLEQWGISDETMRSWSGRASPPSPSDVRPNRPTSTPSRSAGSARSTCSTRTHPCRASGDSTTPRWWPAGRPINCAVGTT